MPRAERFWRTLPSTGKDGVRAKRGGASRRRRPWGGRTRAAARSPWRLVLLALFAASKTEKSLGWQSCFGEAACTHTGAAAAAPKWGRTYQAPGAGPPPLAAATIRGSVSAIRVLRGVCVDGPVIVLPPRTLCFSGDPSGGEHAGGGSEEEPPPPPE